MGIKKKAKSVWKGLTSPESIDRYKKTGRGIKYASSKSAAYIEGTNRGLDNVLGIKASAKDGLAGGYIPKKRKRKNRRRII